METGSLGPGDMAKEERKAASSAGTVRCEGALNSEPLM